MKKHIFCGLILLLTLSASAAERSPDDLARFLRNYCTNCHGAKAQKADRRFDQLATQLLTGKVVNELQQAEQLDGNRKAQEQRPHEGNQAKAVFKFS